MHVRPEARRKGGRCMRWAGRIAGTLLLAGVIVILDAGIASAHAQLETTQPVEGAVLSSSPARVVMHFDQAVEIDLGSVRVIGPGDRRVDEGGTYHPNGQASSIAVNLPPGLSNGTYIVAWRVISADSHPVHGAFIFSLGTDAGAAKANALAAGLANQSGSTTVAVFYWFVRAGFFLGLLLLVGVGILASTGPITLWNAPSPLGRRLRRVLAVCSVLVLVTTLLAIATQGVYASALPLSDLLRPGLISAVLHTRFGEVALLRLILLALALPVLLGLAGRLPGSPRWWKATGAVLGAGLLLTPGLSGHAATDGSAFVGIPLDLLHLLAVSIWLGGLAYLSLVLLGSAPDAVGNDTALTSAALRVSLLALCGVVAIVATGILEAIRQVGSLQGLFGTEYGVILVVKMGLVLAMILLGAVSRQGLHGSLFRQAVGTSGEVGAETAEAAGPSGSASAGGGGRTRRLRRTILLELALGVAVLGVTAALVNSPPSRQVQQQPFTDSWRVLGVEVNVIVSPSASGAAANQFHFYVLGRTGAPVAIPELDAAVTLPSEGIGPISIPLRVAGPGHYAAYRVDLPIAGSWQLKVTVRTTAIDEQVVYATMRVR